MTLQILISTMFRENLDFLKPMFSKNTLEDFDIIIVNQTTKGKELTSNKPNIKVVNSYQRGLPLSRNLAIKHATAEVCLIADDDIVYLPKLKTIIERAYATYKNADMISFQAVDERGGLFDNYTKDSIHNAKTLKRNCSITLSFNRKSFVAQKVYFNKFFGLGSVFKGEDEYVFLMNAFNKGLKMYHCPENIVMHIGVSSGKLMGSDDAFYAKTALRQRFLGNLSYLWLVKYTLYMWKDGYIKFPEIPRKFKIGVAGILKYKALKQTGEIERLYES